MKKSFALRLDSDVYDAIERWAADEFRSVNGQIEWIIADALKRSKRTPKNKTETKTSKMKQIAIALIMVGASLCASAQDWWTAWSPSTGLALCLHLTDSTPQLYSPLQTPDPIPISQCSRRGDTLNIECSTIGLRLSTLRHNDSLYATMRQGILKEQLLFLPSDTLYQIHRPQTPHPPYSFIEETISVDYTDSQGNPIHLEGSLTYPKVGKRFPTMVIVSGSGQQNRDEELLFHKPFLVLAEYLASRGIALLRYDDRGVGQSIGNLDSADTRLFSEDAETMLQAIKKHKHVDRRRLGIGGHSEGGAIAPMVAARNKDVRFVVMLAGQGCTGYDVLLQQNEALYRTAGVSDSLIEIRLDCLRELISLPAGSTQKDFREVIQHHTQALTQAQADSIGLGRGSAYAFMQQLQNPWMWQFIRLNPADYLPQVRVPILALNGDHDCQVLSRPNLAAIRELTHHRADCRSLTGLNHLFQHCNTGHSNEYVQIEETFAPEAMEAIADFILSL